MKNKYDAILYVNPLINEADDRYHAKRSTSSVDKGPGIYADIYDPKLYASNNFGRILQNMINGFGSEFFGEVTDFGKWVVVTVGCHNHASGRTSTKTFLVVFEHKGNGIVVSSSTKWRSISGLDQAASYIRSACSSLQTDASRKL